MSRGCERICERNAAKLPIRLETWRDGVDGRLIVTCRFETREATRDWDRLAHNPEVWRVLPSGLDKAEHTLLEPIHVLGVLSARFPLPSSESVFIKCGPGVGG
jgi:hypothetical protein